MKFAKQNFSSNNTALFWEYGSMLGRRWNLKLVVTTLVTAVLKNPFVQSVFGSALEITPQNISKGKYLANTLFWGKKTGMQFGTETAIGGIFNFTGSAMNKVGPQIPVPLAKGAAETSIYFLNYSLSTGINNNIDENYNKK